MAPCNVGATNRKQCRSRAGIPRCPDTDGFAHAPPLHTIMPQGYAIHDTSKWSDFKVIDFDLKVGGSTADA